MPEPQDQESDLIETIIRRGGSMLIAIVFSKEQASKMAQERPPLLWCVNIPKAAPRRSVRECNRFF
jgi:hypothetical protein